MVTYTRSVKKPQIAMIKYLIDYFYRRGQIEYAAQEPDDIQKHIKY
jgi:hypothetical protein